MDGHHGSASYPSADVRSGSSRSCLSGRLHWPRACLAQCGNRSRCPGCLPKFASGWHVSGYEGPGHSPATADRRDPPGWPFAGGGAATAAHFRPTFDDKPARARRIHARTHQDGPSALATSTSGHPARATAAPHGGTGRSADERVGSCGDSAVARRFGRILTVGVAIQTGTTSGRNGR